LVVIFFSCDPDGTGASRAGLAANVATGAGDATAGGAHRRRKMLGGKTLPTETARIGGRLPVSGVPAKGGCRPRGRGACGSAIRDHAAGGATPRRLPGGAEPVIRPARRYAIDQLFSFIGCSHSILL